MLLVPKNESKVGPLVLLRSRRFMGEGPQIASRLESAILLFGKALSAEPAHSRGWSNSERMQLQAIQGYRIRPRSFIFSVGFHSLVVAALVLIPAYTESAPKEPIYDELIRPEAHKIVWYNFR